MSIQRLSILSVVVLAFVAQPLAGQAAKSKANKPDPVIAEQVKQFKAAIKDRKGARDAEATNLIDKFLGGYPKMHQKDQLAVRKALQDCLVGRVKRDPENTTLFVGAAAALGQMGADGAKILLKAYKSSKFKKQVTLRAVFVRNIGKTKDLRQVEFLLERASRDPDDEIMEAAGGTLRNFADAKLSVRKNIVKELIKKFSEVHGKSRASLASGNAQVKRSKERLAAISRDWNQTLNSLTKQSIHSAPDWQRFYNKNKDRNWDKM